MAGVVGRMIVEKPANRPNISQPKVLPRIDDFGSSSEAASRNSHAAKIVTHRVGTSLITSEEYVMNTGESASVTAASAPATRPNRPRTSQKTPKTETTARPV